MFENGILNGEDKSPRLNQIPKKSYYLQIMPMNLSIKWEQEDKRRRFIYRKQF